MDGHWRPLVANSMKLAIDATASSGSGRKSSCSQRQKSLKRTSEEQYWRQVEGASVSLREVSALVDQPVVLWIQRSCRRPSSTWGCAGAWAHCGPPRGMRLAHWGWGLVGLSRGPAAPGTTAGPSTLGR